MLRVSLFSENYEHNNCAFLKILYIMFTLEDIIKVNKYNYSKYKYSCPGLVLIN